MIETIAPYIGLSMLAFLITFFGLGWKLAKDKKEIKKLGIIIHTN